MQNSAPVIQKDVSPRKRLLNLKHAAEYLDFSMFKMRQMIRRGEIPYIQDGRGGKQFVDVRDLEAWIERNKRQNRSW
jgi:excisionase family DNA binding protein